MPELITPLTDKIIKNAKPKDKPYKLADGGGLYLEISRKGENDASKLWRMKIRQANGKEGRLSFGSYPVVTLAEARHKRDDAKSLITKGIDPAQAERIMRAFEKIEGCMYVPTRIMFRLMLLTFVRTSELTTTEWKEIDFEKEDWVIPWQCMKMGKKKLPPPQTRSSCFLAASRLGFIARATRHYRQ